MSKIYIVNNSVKLPPAEELNTFVHVNDLVFVGKMDYAPNIIAVTFFAKEIYPKLKERYPELTFSIVGARPGDSVNKLQYISGVKVTGFVNSVAPFYKNATIIVAPMLTGAGIQNKIIQAMSFGCCVATTSLGAEGISLDTHPCAIFNGAANWIDGMNDLLFDKDKRKNYGTRARAYVEQNLSHEVIKRQFWAFIDDIDRK